MTLLLSLLGAGLILFALRDIFDTLFHPSGKGMLSRTLPRPLWRGVRRFGAHYPVVRELCGPVTLLAVIASWTVLLAVGWALIFWPHLPSEFAFDPELGPSDHGSFVDALYLSLVTLGRRRKFHIVCLSGTTLKGLGLLARQAPGSGIQRRYERGR